MAKEELAKAKMEVEGTVEKYKTSLNFAIEKACMVMIFRASKEFFNDCICSVSPLRKVTSWVGSSAELKSLTITKARPFFLG